MKKEVLLGAFVVCASMAMAQAKLEVVGGTRIDLGTLDRGTIAERKVTIKNTGKDTLVVQKVEASCGCTGTLVSKDRIPPGKTGEVKITFNSGGFNGQVHKNVTIVSNAAGAERTLVEFVANVVQDLAFVPPQIWFRDAMVGRVSNVSFTIKNESREPVELKGYNSTLSGLTVTLPSEPIAPGQTIQMAGEFKPSQTKPVLSESLTFTTTSKRQPEIVVPIFGTVKEFKFE